MPPLFSPEVTSLPDVLRATAARSPDRPALVGEGFRLTYSELDQCVDALASRLLRAGVGAGDRVGLCLQAGPLALIGSAAIQRLGSAYVPLDVRQPPERLAHIVGNSAMTTAVCDETGSAVAERHRLAVLAVDPDDLEPRPGPPVRPERPASASAYLMYTSGSTGVPKGVEVTQANVLALLRDALPLFGYQDDEVWPLQHAHGFDVSVWEMWAGVAVGATLLSYPQGGENAELLAERMLRHGATRLHIVPSVFRNFAEVVEEERLRIPLRQVVFCGEPISRRAIRTWQRSQTGPHPQWVNVYGITETTVYNTFAALSPEQLAVDDAVTPIGTAYPASPARVVDDGLVTLPPGEQGEILIGGDQVARGYFNDPQRTAERFVSLPGLPGRWYRTGDLGIADRAGSLGYLGRKDDQVKVRGFRIELGEIDHALRALPWVRDGAIALTYSRREEPVLTAFVVPSEPPPGGQLLDSVRRCLADRLPEYMLPNRARQLGQLPLNSNGKTDRRALTTMAEQAATG